MIKKIIAFSGVVFLGIIALLFLKSNLISNYSSDSKSKIVSTTSVTTSFLPTITLTKTPCKVDSKQLNLVDQAIDKFNVDITSYQAKLEKYRNMPEPIGSTMNYEEYKNYVVSKESRLGQSNYEYLLKEMYQKYLENTKAIHDNSLDQFNQKVNNKIIYPLEQLIKKSQERIQILTNMKEKLNTCGSFTDDEMREMINFMNELRIEKKLPTITLIPAFKRLYFTPTPSK